MKKVRVMGFTALTIVLGISSVYAFEFHIWNPPSSSTFDGSSSMFDDWNTSHDWDYGDSTVLPHMGYGSDFSDPLGLWDFRGGRPGIPRTWDGSTPTGLPPIWAR